MAGVVELVLSGSRYKVRLNAQSTYIILALQGIKCLPNDANIKDYQDISNKALTFAKENILQRDVEVEIDAVDNRGTLLGSIIFGKKNFAVTLLENGLAYINPQSKSSKSQSAYEAAEKEAKKNQVGVWKTGLVLNEGAAGFGAKPQKIDEQKVLLCSEITNPETIYLQDSKLKPFHFIQRELENFNEDTEEKLKQPVKAGTPCVAIFMDDGKWYRAKVDHHIKGNKYLVFFMDYGNFDEVILDDIRKMPSKFLSIDPVAQLSGLAYVKTPSLNHQLGDTVAQFLKDRIWNKEVHVNYVYSLNGKKFAILRDLDEKDPKKSINLELISRGYAKIDNEMPIPQELSEIWLKHEENASANELGVWKFDEDEEDQRDDYD